MMSLRRPLLLAVFILLVVLLTLHQPDPLARTLQLPGFWPSGTHDLRLTPPIGIPAYTRAKLTPSQRTRYAHLRHPRVRGPHGLRAASNRSGGGKYLFVTLTRNIEDHLPDLLNAFAVLVSFLGAEHVRFSILEGPSTDDTARILETVLVPMLTHLGVPSRDIVLRTHAPKVDFGKVNRIEVLAGLRNEALEPLWKRGWEDTAAVVYFNDVYLRARDVLELLHQHVRAGERGGGGEVGVTTGLDWWKKSPEYYYDVWVARTMQGDLFYPIESSWSPSTDLFSTSPASAEAYAHLRPFQAFSSWAGVAVLSATPFLRHGVRFRRSVPPPATEAEGLGTGTHAECAASECEMVNRDFWRVGFGRVQVVPSVQVAYERDVARDIERELGQQMKRLGWRDEIPPSAEDVVVEFDSRPPAKVRCQAWPEKNGLDANVWEKTTWGPPYVGA